MVNSGNAIGDWRPGLLAFLESMRQPSGWGIDMDGFGVGIDNVHVDVCLSARFCELTTRTVRRLMVEELTAAAQQLPSQLVTTAELERFRKHYTGLFEAVLARTGAGDAPELPGLLQLALLRWLLEVAARESRVLQEEFKAAGQESLAAGTGRNLALHEQLVLLKRQGPAINRRVLQFLFRQIRKLEASRVSRLRSAVGDITWPLSPDAFFNPILLISDPGNALELAADYPIAHLGTADSDWLRAANGIVADVFADYLPVFCRQPAAKQTSAEPVIRGPARNDQGLLRGFLATELLLSRFVADEEYRRGQISWIDEPVNLRRLLQVQETMAGNDRMPLLSPAQWTSEDWMRFRREIRAQLHRKLFEAGLSEPIVLCYWLPQLKAELGISLALPFVTGYCLDGLPRRRVMQALAPGVDPAAAVRALDRCQSTLRRLKPAEKAAYLDRFLGDFLVLRRDLKLAYKTYEALDRLRLLERDEDIDLSRSNGSLYEFTEHPNGTPRSRRIRAHAIVKADVRGSTRITDELVARGLNPASHFSLNLFGPVNRLLEEYGAEKVFVEGDAVILAVYDDAPKDRNPGPLTVARACGLACSIIHAIALQNLVSRKHGLPELELGLGVAYSPREPNFLYDEGRRIMISAAVNSAHRMSGCTSSLRDSCVEHRVAGQRVLVARDRRRSDEFLAYNVDGIRLEPAAFVELQREISIREVPFRVDEHDDGDYYSGTYEDARGRLRRLSVRRAPLRIWDGHALGHANPAQGHYFEVIADEGLCALMRKAHEDG